MIIIKIQTEEFVEWFLIDMTNLALFTIVLYDCIIQAWPVNSVRIMARLLRLFTIINTSTQTKLVDNYLDFNNFNM